MFIAIPGFICAFRFSGDGVAAALGERDAAILAEPGDGWAWLHLDLVDRRCERWLAGHLGIPHGVAVAFTETARRQQLNSLGGFLIGTLADFRQDFDRESTEHVWSHVLLGANILVTGRVKAIQSAERLRTEIARGQSYSNPAGLFTQMTANYPDRLDTVLHHLTDEIETIEDHILDDRHRGERKRLMLVRREVAQLHRHLRALRRALIHAERTIPGIQADLAPIVMRLQNLDQDFETLEQRARFFHDEIDAKLAAETNRQLYILSALTAAFLPPTLVAGLFGMNFTWLPWSQTDNGFWVALALCAASSAAVWLFLWRANRN